MAETLTLIRPTRGIWGDGEEDGREMRERRGEGNEIGIRARVFICLIAVVFRFVFSLVQFRFRLSEREGGERDSRFLEADKSGERERKKVFQFFIWELD